MKDFLKYVLATVVGVILSTVAMFLFFIMIIIGIASSFDSDKSVVVSDKSVLYLNLDQPILERTPENSLPAMSFLGISENKSIGFPDIVKSLKHAQTDDKIKAVYLNVSAPNMGMATMMEVRNAILDFKKSKKPIIAYSEIYSQGAYLLASAASKVYLNPKGDLELKGLSAELIFFKGALDKLGIEAQIIRVGNYKSAVEPFINTKMSDYNKEQVSMYVNDLYQTFLGEISQSRKISVENLHKMADTYQISNAEEALKAKLVDGLWYKDQVIAELKKITQTTSGSVKIVSINDYVLNVPKTSVSKVKDKIAVIYAVGDIVGGEGSDEQIGSERVSRAIRKAREDKSIKAIVLRVNSGGGSALASEVIWREMELSRKVKPVMASFGDYAASGGYYIGCNADSIFVQPNTITGSIGVFGIIPNLQNLMNNKLGLTFDGVKTGQYADMISTNRPMTPGERYIMQKSVDRTYDVFLSRVAEGRKKTKAQIDSIGGGHVWTGNAAIKNGLADKIGNFEDAIKAAASKAKLTEFRIVEYPEKIDPIKSILESTRDNLKIHFAKKEFGDYYDVFQNLKKTAELKGIQARLPYHIQIQ